MRQKATVVVAAACLLWLVTPAPAHALWGGGWLERLSGPGPFEGLFGGARLLCVSGPTEPDAASPDPLERGSLGRTLTFPRDLDARVWLTPAGCHFLPADQPRLQLGVDFGFLSSSRNLLDYGEDSQIPEGDRQVRLRTFLVTADLRVNRVLDVGAGFGRAWFRSAGGLFETFPKTVTQPLRLTTRPLATFSKDPRVAAFVVLFEGSRFHGGFTAEDFGAVPGTYNEPSELVWSWSVRVDPVALFWRGR